MIDLKKLNFIGYFPVRIDRNQARDTGLAMVLICLLLAFFQGDGPFIVAAIMVLCTVMIIPGIFKPLAVVWLGFSGILGTIMTRLILALLFYFMVTPIGLLRRLFGCDPLMLKRWKKDTGSVFTERNARVGPGEVKKPY